MLDRRRNEIIPKQDFLTAFLSSLVDRHCSSTERGKINDGINSVYGIIVFKL